MLGTRVDINADSLKLSTRTPGRNRAQNAKAGGFSTTGRKGKHELATKTPLHPASAQLKRLLKDPKPNHGIVTQPLGDKTPLPNRLTTVVFQTPFDKPEVAKQNAASVVDNGNANTPGTLERPSSQRRHPRLPRNHHAKNFETPMNNDRHWELSNEDISVPVVQSVTEEKTLEDERDLDEIEYCAPNTLDLPYQPPFDFELPNYREVGKALHELAFSVPVDDSPGFPEHDIPASELEQVACNLPDLPPLDSDDPFELARLQCNRSEKPTLIHQTKGIFHRRALSSQSSLRTLSRNSTQVARAPPPKAAAFAPSRVTKQTKTIGTAQPTSQSKTGSRPIVAMPARLRPQTSFSVALRREPLLRPKSAVSIKNAQQGISLTLDIKSFGYEDFMFEV